MPVARLVRVLTSATTWNIARKCMVNSHVASIINTNPVTVPDPCTTPVKHHPCCKSVRAPLSLSSMCVNSTIVGPLYAHDMFAPIKLSLICCAVVCNPRTSHRRASVYNIPVGSANFIIARLNVQLILNLILTLYPDNIKRVSENLLLIPNHYPVCIFCTVYLYAYTIHNDP
jgi:hypothetical protein